MVQVDDCVPEPAMILCGTLQRYIQMSEEITAGFALHDHDWEVASNTVSMASLESFDAVVSSPLDMVHQRVEEIA